MESDVVFQPSVEEDIFLKGGKHLRLLKIVKAHDGKHKYEAVFKVESVDGKSHEKTVKFGAVGYEDYTSHHDEERKRRYLERHRERETWSKPDSAGALSRWILWNKPSFRDSVTDFKRRFHLHG